jgi:predicted NBD/HSP70 family sugar kinase
VYAYGAGEGLGMRAAVVNPASGEFLRAGAQTPLASTAPEVIAEALKKIADSYDWDGVVGVGLPGVVSREDVKADDSSSRLGRVALEEQLTAATGRDIMVMTGAEANGYADVAFGSMSEETPELVLVVTLGRGIGAALFEHGLLVRNLSLHHITRTWGDARWKGAALPATEGSDEGAWERWGARVGEFLAQLEDLTKPDAIVIAGSAAASLDEWRQHLDTRAPVVGSDIGVVAGVKGSAYGANMQRTTHAELVELREALGRRVDAAVAANGSNSLDDVLHEMFDDIDASGDGYLQPDEIQAAAARLGVKLTAAEAEAVVLELDTDTLQRVALSYEEFVEWYATTKLYAAGGVEQLMSEEDFDRALTDEKQSGRLVCLEVGFTFCRPCKAFKPKYEKIARGMPDVRFLYMNGNENSSCVGLARDRLQVRSSPSFYFFRGGEQVHTHTGANEERLSSFLDEYVADPTLRDPPEGEEDAEKDQAAEEEAAV